MIRNKSLFIVSIAYFLAITSGFLFIILFPQLRIQYPVLTILIADIIATIVIYLFSYYYSNSSIYDPYWSVIPPIILLYWILIENVISINVLVLMFSVLFWSLRLTFNWIRGWGGLDSEDWRYIDMRVQSGRYFEISNFLGIHLFPTLIVFGCCISFKYSINKTIDNISFIIGFIICFIGVMYEIIADQQLYNFKISNKNKIIKKGLWAYSRHPNYYGEILFWFGLFAYGFDYGDLLLIIPPILMLLMFIFVSIPWIENKILRTRSEYKKYQKDVSMLFPEISYIKKLLR